VGSSTSTTDDTGVYPLVANWLWQIPDFVMLNNDEE
jgi:hypothetical protein